MFTDAYRGRGVSHLAYTYALTSLFMFLSYGVLFYLQKFNLTFIPKGLVCQKWLFFSNEINFCCNEITFSQFSKPKLAERVLILIKQNLRYTLNFSVTPYFEKSFYLRGYFTSIFTDIVLYYCCYCCCYCYLMLLLQQFLN